MKVSIANPANLITLTKLLGVPILIVSPPETASVACLAFIALFWLCDLLDGAVARKFNVCSKFGAAFDLATDRIADLACAAISLMHCTGLTVTLVSAYLIIRFGFEPLVLTRLARPASLGSAIAWWTRWPAKLRECLIRIALEAVSLGKALFFGLALFDPLPSGVLDEIAVSVSRMWFAMICAGYLCLVIAVLRQPTDRAAALSATSIAADPK
ncbi:CDP-alcohol phosphatidyltransferase [Burkholderia ubonensis]|uniref:CDP-alcohol phosphatidyltransferase family protein n=1 Tax=Burkholderia ubonensis TaxID=101571 RepID=UPI00075D6BA4|nr:CDP-alcohol phosphatidyltransferase family protein [Burkholderia ubonensis]KVV46696.1 CDP-alcohol phosphatidyltransferase [Burkholderia ubonensis]KVW13708.1 CDP-alcohol phosphatidyltransferase [Burkholderia ubonensis]